MKFRGESYAMLHRKISAEVVAREFINRADE